MTIRRLIIDYYYRWRKSPIINVTCLQFLEYIKLSIFSNLAVLNHEELIYQRSPD